MRQIYIKRRKRQIREIKLSRRRKKNDYDPTRN